MSRDKNVDIKWPRDFNVIPKSVFNRPEVFTAELERIYYGPVWHPIAHISEIPQVGDFKTFQIGLAPVLLVHGDDGKPRVFYNSCPHRGTQLKTCARGHANEIECPYHRWSFGLKGNLVGAPGIKQFSPKFRKEDFGLRELRSDSFHGLIFATCSDETPPLEEFLSGATDFIEKALGDDGRLNLIGYQKTVYATNWKEYNDNEGYHAPLLHGAFKMLRWQGGKGYYGISKHGHKVSEAEVQPPQPGFLADHSLIEFRASGPQNSIIVALWPITTMTKHMDVINVRFAFPLSADKVEVHYAYYSHHDDTPEMVGHRIRQASNLLGPSGFISLEDGAVFSRVHSGSYAPGTVAFQKGFREPVEPPCDTAQNEEAGNLARWEMYRKAMGFDRV